MSDTPTIAWASPRPDEVFRAYVGDKLKVRELNDGTVQYAVSDGDWVDAE